MLSMVLTEDILLTVFFSINSISRLEIARQICFNGLLKVAIVVKIPKFPLKNR